MARSSALLPDHDFTDHAPPNPDELDLPPSRITPPAALAALCSVDPVDRAAHARGKAFRDVVLNLRGRLENVPDLIARPRHERDVIDVLDWCTGESIPVIPYGGGSSVVGGVEPRFDGPAVTVDLTDMDEVLEIDAVSRAARIQAGALGPGSRKPVAATRTHTAALSAIVRVLHPRRMAGDPRGRTFRHALHPHRRPDGGLARRHPCRCQ